MSKISLSILLVLALLLAGCGEDASTGASGDGSTVRIPAPATLPLLTEAEVSRRRGDDGLMGPEPKPFVPDAPPPDSLVIADLREGRGEFPALEGRLVTVQFVGVLYDSGSRFGSSWDLGRPSTFRLGRGEVVEGWEEGIPGMEVGGRRELVVPPNLAYGSKRVGAVPPNSTLVYVVDLLAVHMGV
ncbi:MAG TPA: FKBP-type peptidyl-prolyl cis-trans isomerase [Solirubrobacterales bacterium]|nr:FKBP-type peptidyl-prolyl cis-trans isomerase [Solirubrobacterales bacterium]